MDVLPYVLLCLVHLIQSCSVCLVARQLSVTGAEPLLLQNV